MTRDYQPYEIAKGRIEIGIARMVEKYPFHVAILERFKIAARPDVGTMGATVSGKDLLLLHNPEFVLSLSAGELQGTLLHEVHHVLFGHVLADPDDYPDEWARTIAEEITANEFIEEPLPGGAIKLEQFPRFPEMESTGKRYDRLRGRVSREPISTPRDMGGNHEGDADGNQDGDRGAGNERMGKDGGQDAGQGGDDNGGEGGGGGACEGSSSQGVSGQRSRDRGGARQSSPNISGQGDGNQGDGNQGDGNQGEGGQGGSGRGSGGRGGRGNPGQRDGGQGDGGQGDGGQGDGGQGDGGQGDGGQGGGRGPVGSGQRSGGYGGQGGNGRGDCGLGGGGEPGGSGGRSGSGQGVCHPRGHESDRRQSPRRPNKPSVGRTVDDHGVWEEARKDRREAEAVIENAIREATLEVGMERVPVYIRGPANAPAGNAPGAGQYELEGSSTGKLPWPQLLRRYIGQMRQVRPVFNHPPRRFPHLVGIVPGKRRQPDRPKIMVVIDTSGSMTDDLLELVDAELVKLARDHVVTIVECDYAIQRVYEYRDRLKTLAGRGGTSFHPPLEKDFLRKHRPDLIVFFTDGQGSAPTKPPPIPLIWCLTPEGQAPVEWGREICMQAP